VSRRVAIIMAERILMGRYGRPEEVAVVVRFLASEEAGCSTGRAMPADGVMMRSLP